MKKIIKIQYERKKMKIKIINQDTIEIGAEQEEMDMLIAEIETKKIQIYKNIENGKIKIICDKDAFYQKII